MVLDEATRQILLDVGLALGLGLLIGLERERHRRERLMLAGVRTYPLVSLTGLLTATFDVRLQAGLLVSIGALVFGGFSLFMYWVRQREGTTGLTSPIALFATYFVGVLVGNGEAFWATLVGLSIAVLLFTKERLHRVADVMTPQEMEGALYFLILALILYPVLPEDAIDPWGLVRLRAFLLIVLVVSVISFASFLAIRRWGSRFGLPFSGFLGGLVNSEATSLSLAHLQTKREGLTHAARVGVLLATGTLFVRNLAIAAIADPSLALLFPMMVPMIGAALVYFLWALATNARDATPPPKLDLESPFAFRPAFWFAFWFTTVSIVSVLLTRSEAVGEKGVYVAALGGLVSAGAVVASMGALVASGASNVDPGAAAVTAVVASLISAANKVGIARAGGPAFARSLLTPTVAGVALGAVLLLARPLWSSFLP